MPRILMVEDDDDWADVVRRNFGLIDGLRDRCQIVRVATLAAADQELHKGERFDLVLLDACMAGNRIDTLPLLARILGAGIHGPVIAMSSVDIYNRMLVEHGCVEGTTKRQAHEVAARRLAQS